MAGHARDARASRRPVLADLAALGVVSATALGFEVVLARLVAITHPADMAPIVIALGVAGFGAAGSVGAVMARTMVARPDRWMLSSALGLAVVLPLSVTLAQRVPLSVLELPWHPGQAGYLLLYAACLLVPFLAAGLYLTTALVRWSEQVSRVVAVNLVGSAMGPLLALGLLQAVGPERAVVVLAGLAAGAATIHGSRPRRSLAVVLAAVALWLSLGAPGPVLRPAETQPLSKRLLEHNARILWQVDDARARASVVRAPGLHAAPGLSLSTTGRAPPQDALYLDGADAGPLLRLDPSAPGPETLREALGAAPYQLVGPGASVAVAGGRASWSAWVAQASGAERVDLVVAMPSVRSVLAGEFGGPERPQALPAIARIVPGSARSWLADGSTRFDVIALDASTSTAGLPAARLAFDLTVESFDAGLGRLNKGGLLVVGGQLRPLPRDAVRLGATAVAALRARGLEPRPRIAMVRDWRSTVLMVSVDPIGPDAAARLRAWCDRWGFDLVALPELDETEVNRFHRRDGAPWFHAMDALMDTESAPGFLSSYAFDVRPVHDDAPYFYRFFRWSTIPHLRATLGPDWLRHVGWGYLLEVAALLVLSLGSVGLILGPLVMGRMGGFGLGRATHVLVYFGAIGLGFMFVEVAMLLLATRLFGASTVALAVVLTSMLLSVGIGCAWLRSRTLPDRWVLPLFGLLAAGFTVSGLVLSTVADELAGWPPWSIGCTFVAMIGVGTVSMGLPLPHGITRIRPQGDAVVAWAWGVNGLAGIVGALAAPLIAMHGGFRMLLVSAVGCYLVAAWADRGSTPPLAGRESPGPGVQDSG